MAEGCVRQLLLDRYWMKVGMSGMKRQGLSVQLPGQNIEGCEAGRV